MLKSILFSLLLSILSLIIVFVAPIEISLRDTGQVYSPYRDEIDQLLEKGERELTPTESSNLSILIEKNNQWFEEFHKEYKKSTAPTALEAWKKKSDILSPAIMVLWGILFYFLYRRKIDPHALGVLVFPIVLGLVQLMSILQIVLIIFVVLINYFWFILKRQLDRPSDRPER